MVQRLAIFGGVVMSIDMEEVYHLVGLGDADEIGRWIVKVLSHMGTSRLTVRWWYDN